MRLAVITVIILVISVQTQSVQPSSWAKQLIRSVKNKISNVWITSNKTRLDTPMPHEKSQFSSFMDKARQLKKMVFENLKPGGNSERDPGVVMTTPQLITINNYPAESHTIATQDGYLLTVHRIPYSRKRQKKVGSKTVLLHHGLLGSSADWVLAGPEKSLAYILSDQGYDVWMANVRGNSYSRAHRTIDPNSFAFWNFTFHEVSQYDLPAVIDYIKYYKEDCSLHYIGHSMGTTVLFALLSTKTQYNKVLKSAIALAPVAYMTDIQSPIRLFAKYSSNINFLLKLFGANEFLPQNDVLRWLSENMCNKFTKAICENLIFILCGHDEKQFDKGMLPMILGHVPAGTSTLTLVHYAQEIKNEGRFQQFDYGSEKNLKFYGSLAPPTYPIKEITLPIGLMSAKNDWLASAKDVTNLSATLPNVFDDYVVPYDDFNHMDFLWASDARNLVYNHIIDQLYQFENSVSKFSKPSEVEKHFLTDPFTIIKQEPPSQGLKQDKNMPMAVTISDKMPTIADKMPSISDNPSTISESMKTLPIVPESDKSLISYYQLPTTRAERPYESYNLPSGNDELPWASYNVLRISGKLPREELKPLLPKKGMKKGTSVDSFITYNKVYPTNVVYKSFFR